MTDTIDSWVQQVRDIRQCRICGNPSLERVIDLGEQALASLFNDGRPENQFDTPIPLEVVRCQAPPAGRGCGFVQLKQTVPPSILYQDYGYRSGINHTMRAHLEGLVREVESRIPLRTGDLVVDIGANDGTTLLAYREPGLLRVGFEPSNIQPQQPDHGLHYLPAVFNRHDFHAKFPGRRARVVTSIAMFYDVDAPVAFCEMLRDILADDGLWVLEMSYLGSMLEHNTFDTICHEHLGYYSLHALEQVIERTGFRFFDVSFNDANGGSLRCTMVKRDAPLVIPPAQQARIDQARQRELEQGYLDLPRLAQFRSGVEQIRQDLVALLERCRQEGKRVYGYGASTKGNVLLQYCRISRQHLAAIADRNPSKVGRTTLGTQLPICSEEEMRRARPDYLLVLPWHFLEEFMEREAGLRAGGTRFIVPFPQVRVI